MSVPSGATAQPRWGFHQLSERTARRLVADSGVGDGDLVLDIGAGTGALTQHLVAVGAIVVAIELHPGRADILRSRFADEQVTVVRADAGDLRLPKRPFHVVANPPFGLTTAILRRLLHPGSRLVRADLIVPMYVARRWTDRRAPGAGRWGSVYHAGVGPTIPPSAFTPRGPLSATLVLRARRLS